MQGVEHFVTVLLNRLAPDFGARAGAEAASELLADLDLDVRLVVQERLGIGVDRDELHPGQTLGHHAVERIPAAPADADHLHAGVLRNGFLKFEDHESLGPRSEEVLEPTLERRHQFVHGPA